MDEEFPKSSSYNDNQQILKLFPGRPCALRNIGAIARFSRRKLLKVEFYIVNI